jgi:hypothetical protein
MATGAQSALDAFRALARADIDVQGALAPLVDRAEFAVCAAALATTRGIPLEANDVRAAAQSDPAGIARFLPAPASATAWPPATWLPISIAVLPDGVFVDWAFVGAPDGRLFDAAAAARARDTPFNRAVGWRMTLADFVRGAPAATPAGLVFHMSRCGSTVAARMLAALPGRRAVSELRVFDEALQLDQLLPALAPRDHAAILRALLAAFAGAFVKLEAWHAMLLPLFRAAAPTVPWVFLYRDPVEVLVSHTRSSAMHVDILPAHYGALSTAQALAAICDAAAARSRDGGLLADYRELPGAVADRMLPHFGIVCGESERALVARAAHTDAKAPRAFTPDSAAKQREAGDALREAAERELVPAYRRLQTLRATEIS